MHIYDYGLEREAWVSVLPSRFFAFLIIIDLNRFITELKRRAGHGKDVSRQMIINERLREAVVEIKKRKFSEVD